MLLQRGRILIDDEDAKLSHEYVQRGGNMTETEFFENVEAVKRENLEFIEAEFV